MDTKKSEAADDKLQTEVAQDGPAKPVVPRHRTPTVTDRYAQERAAQPMNKVPEIYRDWSGLS